jgi:hypothetical protein
MAAELLPECAMEFNPTASPSFKSEAARWSTTCIRPSLPHRYSVRTPKWHSLADAAETIGLRFWHDLLAAFTRLAACRNLGPDSLPVAELAFS